MPKIHKWNQNNVTNGKPIEVTLYWMKGDNKYVHTCVVVLQLTLGSGGCSPPENGQWRGEPNCFGAVCWFPESSGGIGSKVWRSNSDWVSLDFLCCYIADPSLFLCTHGLRLSWNCLQNTYIFKYEDINESRKCVSNVWTHNLIMAQNCHRDKTFINCRGNVLSKI